MAEQWKPGLDLSSADGSEEKMGAQKISVSDHINGFQYTTQNSDSFVVDMESISLTTSKEVPANSRITFQRSFSRKGSQRQGGGGGGIEKKTTSNVSANEREAVATSSPKAPAGCGVPEKPAGMAVGTTDHSCSPQVHHQITITAPIINPTTESKLTVRRNSFRRHSPSWFLDPKRILLLFATLSSMGTILLIYFTLSMSKPDAPDWQR